ncbi:MAG: DNA-directed RNA polymerase subunit beta [Nitrospirae bacterium GWC2_57_13]|jgi:DNA-directed RNA polymerase subunit beta|nr:MAG: DNA-directed RNA polymerase subunit beta [Nitrospirae bacterium GWC2_57_13]OGW45932.1 MAG: DNA-directed RNA polymerase subunit beta [Nitrospirae bacterium GWD2_57_8]
MSKQRREQVRVRKDFSNIPAILEIPDLIEIQKRSYDNFLQKEIASDKRKEQGLQAAFKSVFPIHDFNETAMVEYLGFSLGDPKYSVWECLQRGATYAAPLKIKTRLVFFEKDEQAETKRVKDIRDQEVYVGDLPLMTDTGTFIVNGTERVVVSQLHRSPGAFFTHDKGRTHTSGKVIYSARIIPYRGSWLDFEFDVKDIVYVRIDRRRKIPATILLKAFGYSNEDLLRLYYPIENIRVTKDGFMRGVNADVLTGMKAPVTITEKGSREVIVKEGAKITRMVIKKMESAGITEIPIAAEDLIDRVALRDVIDAETGEVLVPANEKITEAVIEKLPGAKVEKMEVIYMDGIHVISAMRDTLMSDKVQSSDEALLEIYRKMRPGEPPTVEMSRTLFQGLFFNAKRYDLSPVGRLKLNKKLNLDVSLEKTTLTPQDVVEVIRYLVNLRTGRGEVDDIDHLGNRRVRSVGELLENQIRVGLARMERAIKERMSLQDVDALMPHDVINPKPAIAAIKEFFGSSQLSQFMDQTNPLAEITHKRRLSALGPGGLTRERAGFEVRDVHPTHYGRICPIETPEGPNIGLIVSLATYARVNDYGFIEAPYREMKESKVTDKIEYLSAIEGEHFVIAQANTPVDGRGKISAATVSARVGGEFKMVTPEEVQYMDVSPKQIVSVSAALIPFLENDDANRALMGSNMQRQAVPLLRPEAPVVGTGMERVAARDSGAIVLAKRDGVVEAVDSTRIVVKGEDARGRTVVDTYQLTKFHRSNQNTCLNQKPIHRIGEKVKKGVVIADGPATDSGELALGQNVLVAFMPWSGYNFEDAIIISEKLVKEDRYTSIHIEEFEIEARDTKLGKEDITRDIPNLGEDTLRNLDENGIIRIGAEVLSGDILVGKVTPKGETQLTPEEKLLRAIFGEKAGDVRDASLYAPPGIEGTVIDVKVFSRRGEDKNERLKTQEGEEIARLQKEYAEEKKAVQEDKFKRIRRILLGKTTADKVVSAKTGRTDIAKGKKLTADMLDKVPEKELPKIKVDSVEYPAKLQEVLDGSENQLSILETIYDEKIGRLKRGDDLPPGVIKLVKIYVAMKRKLSVGDKMAGRHGNKGVVSRIVPEEDMPYLPDGTPVEIVLNPLGVPSRMNVGQILETHLGWAAKALGLHVATPVFDGATEDRIRSLLKDAKLPVTGQTILHDGRTGDPFDKPVTVGYMYMLKLHHLVDDKLHARSIGPYSLVTQQPLGGKAQFGGQRLGEMEVWALQAYGAAYCLQEFLTVKSDDVAGRAKIYEAIVKGESTLEPGLPESFYVLVKELQSLCLDVELLERKEGKERVITLDKTGAAAAK